MIGYWGAISEKELKQAYRLSGIYKTNLQQGIALAALLRSTSGSMPDHTVGASEIICKLAINELISLGANLAKNSEPNSGRDYFRMQIQLASLFTNQ
jgi:hypothetical protein